jgi:cysteine desulfurase/selenocysteine lyase
MEHHSNLVPWQQLCKQHGIAFKTIALTPDDRLDLADARSKITKATRVVAVTHASNVLGTINPVQTLAKLAHDNGAIIVVDGAQAVAHFPLDMKLLDVDCYAFSGHKMYGPEGIGVLYAKRALLERLPPSTWGGEMVRDVTVTDATWNDLPYKFEAGTPDITQAVGLGTAVDYIESIGWDRLQRHEQELLTYGLEQLQRIAAVQIIGPQTLQDRVGAISFIVHGIHAHDVAQVLSDAGVAVRAGHHCAKPLHCEKGLDATARASIGIYTTKSDIDRLIAGIKRALEVFA